MDWPLIVFIVGFIAIFILRVPLAFGMLATATAYMLVAGLDIGLMAEKVLSNLYSVFIIIAVPLFVFTAKVMNSSKVSDMIYDVAHAMVGRVRGGMGHVNVIGSLIFSGMTGSAVADASGVGILEITQMRRHGFDAGFSCAVTVTSATIGPVFPPSIPMIFYAMLSGASVGALFMGGMVPGVLVSIALMIYVAYIAKKRNYPRGHPFSVTRLLTARGQSFRSSVDPGDFAGRHLQRVCHPHRSRSAGRLLRHCDFISGLPLDGLKRVG